MEWASHPVLPEANKMIPQLITDLNIVYAFDFVQTVVVIATIAVGFGILTYTLFQKRHKPVLCLVCALCCGFVQVCYCATTLIATKNDIDRFYPLYFKCSDLNSIPTLCNVITMAVFISSAIGQCYKNSKAGWLMKYTFFIYILVCTFVSIAVQSKRQLFVSPRYFIRRQISVQSTSCVGDPTNDLIIAFSELIVIYFPMLMVLLLVKIKVKQNGDSKNVSFFTPCNRTMSCSTCEYQNTICKIVLSAFLICFVIIRPIDVVSSAAFGIIHSNILQSLASTIMYVYLCFEYCIILQNCCKVCTETQTDFNLSDDENNLSIAGKDSMDMCFNKKDVNETLKCPEAVMTIGTATIIDKALIVPFSVPTCI